MRLLLLLATLALLSCGQNDKAKKSSSDPKDSFGGENTDTTVVKKDSIVKPLPQFYVAPGEAAVNTSLSSKPGNKWHVLNDREARWIKDAFEYFIVPKRKDNPDYPYITTGDFNGDGKTDSAAVVTDEKKKEFRIAILDGSGKIQFWKDDVLINAALTTVPKGIMEGGDPEHPKKVKLKADGINVEYFEQASFVIYRSGNSFKRLQTGD